MSSESTCFECKYLCSTSVAREVLHLFAGRVDGATAAAVQQKYTQRKLARVRRRVSVMAFGQRDSTVNEPHTQHDTSELEAALRQAEDISPAVFLFAIRPLECQREASSNSRSGADQTALLDDAGSILLNAGKFRGIEKVRVKHDFHKLPTLHDLQNRNRVRRNGVERLLEACLVHGLRVDHWSESNILPCQHDPMGSAVLAVLREEEAKYYTSPGVPDIVAAMSLEPNVIWTDGRSMTSIREDRLEGATRILPMFSHDVPVLQEVMLDLHSEMRLNTGSGAPADQCASLWAEFVRSRSRHNPYFEEDDDTLGIGSQQQGLGGEEEEALLPLSKGAMEAHVFFEGLFAKMCGDASLE